MRSAGRQGTRAQTRLLQQAQPSRPPPAGGAPLLKTKSPVLNHRIAGAGTGFHSGAFSSGMFIRIMKALKKSAKSVPATARNTPNPIFAAGRDGAPASPIGPVSSQGFVVILCCASHQAITAITAARKRARTLIPAPPALRVLSRAGFAAEN